MTAAGSGPERHAEAAKSVYVPYGLRLMAAWSWRGILVVAAAALLVKGLSAVVIVFIPVLVSLLVAALLSPVVDALEKRRWRRSLATGAVFLAAIVIVAGLIGLTGQQIATGFASLSDQAVAGYKSLIGSLKSGGVSSQQLSHWMGEVLGVPLVIPLGILVFLGSFIPIVGAIITGIVAVLVAFVANGWLTAVIMLGIVIVVQQAESNALQPFLMGGKLAIHPLGIILAVAAGSFLLGIAGALFAVPFVAVANAVIPALANRDQNQAPPQNTA